ncbi:hypothetical protein J6590_097832 [Homalodisca vitripennis]|nr:hypothetical protein J6590_097832 [Homalodisca vitripennis]
MLQNQANHSEQFVITHSRNGYTIISGSQRSNVTKCRMTSLHCVTVDCCNCSGCESQTLIANANLPLPHPLFSTHQYQPIIPRNQLDLFLTCSVRLQPANKAANNQLIHTRIVTFAIILTIFND